MKRDLPAQQTIVISDDLYSAEACSSLAWQIDNTPKQAGETIALDFRNVRIITSFALRTILEAHHQCKRAQASIAIQNARGAVLAIINSIRLHRFINIGQTNNSGKIR